MTFWNKVYLHHLKQQEEKMEKRAELLWSAKFMNPYEGLIIYG